MHPAAFLHSPVLPAIFDCVMQTTAALDQDANTAKTLKLFFGVIINHYYTSSFGPTVLFSKLAITQ
jgi:hypothetical protein